MDIKKVKTPMTIGLILYGVAFLITILCTLAQKLIFDQGLTHDINRMVVPLNLFTQLIALLMVTIFWLVIRTNGDNEANRSSGLAMIVVYCVENIILPYVSRIGTIFAARMGSEYLGAVSVLEAYISMFTAPFCTVAAVLVIVALGRYTI